MTDKSLGGQSGSHFLLQLLGSKRLPDEAIGPNPGKPHVSSVEAAGHQDWEIRMSSTTRVEELVNWHGNAAVVRDQEIRLPLVGFQDCQRLRTIVESPHSVTSCFQQRGV